MRGTSLGTGAAFAAALAVAGWLGFAAVPAEAGLLRCKGADGKMIYTDNKALCPQSKPFEPEGELQSGSSGTVSEPASANPQGGIDERRRRAELRRRAADAEESKARRWREKKAQLEQELASVAARREYLGQFVGLCNRGGSVTTRDESGIKKRVKCKSLETEFRSLEGAEAKVQAALNRLPEECRRAGCLPGWLR